ncbi:hypothetical protein AB0D33_34840 [Streptomyces sp. NPDC048404]|uniref:hypothetical protein n=1 Tax=unclassified Streptomyces TaxID=2593676 RepID=UPI00341665F6
MALALATAGGLRGAADLARTIPDLGLRATALTQASGALLSAGELQAAADAARSIPDPAERVNALAGMASTLNATGQDSDAAGHLTDAAGDEAAGRALLCEALSVGTGTQTLRAIPRSRRNCSRRCRPC